MHVPAYPDGADCRNERCRHGPGCRWPQPWNRSGLERGSAARNFHPTGPVYLTRGVYYLQEPIAPLSAAGKPRLLCLGGLLQLLEALHQLPVGDQVHPTRTPNTKTASPRFFQYHRPFGHGGLLHFMALTNLMWQRPKCRGQNLPWDPLARFGSLVVAAAPVIPGSYTAHRARQTMRATESKAPAQPPWVGPVTGLRRQPTTRAS